MARKILAIASGGGHWVQLRRLRPVFSGFDITYVSVIADYADDVAGYRFLAVRDVNRWDRMGFVVLFAQLVRILWRERPDIVVTTGAAPGLMALLLAKVIWRSRTIWIDSIANCQQMSGSGRLARRFADVCLTQWPHLKQPGGPDHWGSVL